jgi:hypothetical protein
MTMISLDDFQDLMRRVEEVRRGRDQELGAIKQRRKQLKENYDVDDLDEAKTLRDKAHRRMMAKSEKCLEAKKKFEAILARRPKET